MRVLVVGGGGREHALCAKLATDPDVDRVIAAPGNAGIAAVASMAPVDVADVEAVAALAEAESVDLTVVGPEAPLVAGLADALRARGRAVFGPGTAGARIEGSKSWARWLCEAHGIPVPRSAAFTDAAAAVAHLERSAPPFVVKADGLAAGKGVTVTEDLAEAVRAVEDCLVRAAFGEAGRTVLVEEHLTGREVSAMAFVDGATVVPMPLAQDAKRALDGDRGPNTGGMGAYSPLPWVDPATEAIIHHDVLRATAKALEAEGVAYRGVLYAGLMLTANGPKVLEFNCRFGDPETQAVVPRLRSGLAELLLAFADGRSGDVDPTWTDEACVAVVLASGGYPGRIEPGLPITGLSEAAAVPRVDVFHSGTASRDGRVCTAGGRVLTISGRGRDVAEARRAAYDAAALVRFEGMQYRSDIAGGAQKGMSG
jgi:phosphoribosylamine--glycine ligase